MHRLSSKLLHIFFMPRGRLIAHALRQVLTLFNEEIALTRMSGIFSLPSRQEPLLIVWSTDCGPIQELNWLIKFDEAIGISSCLSCYLIEVGDVRNSFVNYLIMNGAKRLSLNRVVSDYVLSASAQFKPQPIHESEQISVSIKRNLGHGRFELERKSNILSNIFPWLETYLEKDKDAQRTGNYSR